MRYRDLFDARAWKKYEGRDRPCFIVRIRPEGIEETSAVAVSVQFGSVLTGKQRVWVGYFVQVAEPNGKEWLAEDAHLLIGALQAVERLLSADGWSLAAIGLTADWHETGLSANSGFGHHPAFDRAVHMLEPIVIS